VTRDQFEHAVRAAGAVLGARDVLVIGSQALHASVQGRLPAEALQSVEVDVAALRGDPDGTLADLIDGSIGEASLFHATFGYYAQGVVESTAVLPAGWRKRLVRYDRPGTAGVVAWCLEAHARLSPTGTPVLPLPASAGRWSEWHVEVGVVGL
jgi:hypothetical protein